MTPDAALARLDRFGSADAIAQHLADLGCTGFQRSFMTCPVARYVVAETGKKIFIDSGSWFLFEDGEAEQAATPSNVRDFIVDFDLDAFPDLNEEAAA